MRRLAYMAPLFVLGAVVAACSSSSSSPKANNTSATAPAATTVSGPGGALSRANDTTLASAVTLNGAGANSIEPFFERVFYDYTHKVSGATVNYAPAGSSVGISDIQQGTVDFGDSEIPMSSTDLAKATGPVLQIPVDLGGVAISYDIPGITGTLKLDGPTLAGIFDGSITNWDAPQISAIAGNPRLPDLPIVAVHRADSSGPGWDLDAYLIKTAPDWVAKIGTSTPSKTWPLASVGVGQQLNSGVANYVHQTAGAIGFVEYGYALQAGFKNVAVKNAAGKFVEPSEQSIGLAGANASALSSSNFSIINSAGSSTYPLANFSWTLLYQKQADENKGIALGKLFDYVVTTGQHDAAILGYAPLPSSVATLAVRTLEQLETSAGSPLFSH